MIAGGTVFLQSVSPFEAMKANTFLNPRIARIPLLKIVPSISGNPSNEKKTWRIDPKSIGMIIPGKMEEREIIETTSHFSKLRPLRIF